MAQQVDDTSSPVGEGDLLVSEPGAEDDMIPEPVAEEDAAGSGGTSVLLGCGSYQVSAWL